MEAHADAARGRLESVTAMTVERTRSLHHAAKRREDGMALKGTGTWKAEEPWAGRVGNNFSGWEALV
jgi:hypothetical protein